MFSTLVCGVFTKLKKASWQQRNPWYNEGKGVAPRRARKPKRSKVALSLSHAALQHSLQTSPFLYRGYYYDVDLNLYVTGTRYYDPAIGRFINADDSSAITATPEALTDKNLYAYCDNNPVMRADHGGAFWDTLFDVASLVASVVDVVMNPGDAWVV